MSRERTDADDFSLAMFGAIVVAVVLIFVIAGCALLVNNKPADCSVYLDSDNTILLKLNSSVQRKI